MPTGVTSEFVADYEGDPSRWNTSKLIWDLTNAGRKIGTESAEIEGMNIEDLDWICAIGVIADYGFRKWSNFLRGVYERYADGADSSEPKMDFSGRFSLSRTIYNSGLGRIVKLIGLVNKDNDPNAVQKIYELIDSNAIALAKKPEPLLNLMLVRIPELEVIEREADRYIPQVLPTTDCPDLMLLDLPEGSRDLRNSVSGIVAAQNPDRYVLVTRRESGKVKLSLRCEILGFEPELMDETGRQKHEQKMMQYRSCEELIGTVASKFGGGGGGHIAAAGGRVPEARYVEFLSELKREINSERLILN